MESSINKTLEQLENVFWPEPEYDTYLLKTCHALRKKLLRDYEIEDLRIMLGQNIGLDYLIPLAIARLKDDILAEGHIYEGDLLNNLLGTNRDYWTKNKERWEIVCRLFNENRKRLKQFDTTDEIRSSWFESFDKFEKINKTHANKG